jgi:hypothetical protein
MRTLFRSRNTNQTFHRYKLSSFSGAGNCECGAAKAARQHQSWFWRHNNPNKPWRYL